MQFIVQTTSIVVKIKINKTVQLAVNIGNVNKEKIHLRKNTYAERITLIMISVLNSGKQKRKQSRPLI